MLISPKWRVVHTMLNGHLWRAWPVIGMILLVLLFGSMAVSFAAEPAAARPLEDSIAQRVIACTACHGDAGRATSDGFFPRIASKPADYLYNQLLNFRAGRRRSPPMTYMVEYLSDAYLHEIARYFSDLHPPYPPPQPVRANAATLERGRQLVQLGDRSKQVPACIACHGQRLTGTLPTIPGLIGLSHDYLNAQFGAWKNETRRASAPDCMAQIINRLSDQDLNAAASWLAAQPPPGPENGAPQPRVEHALPLPCGSFPE